MVQSGSSTSHSTLLSRQAWDQNSQKYQRDMQWHDASHDLKQTCMVTGRTPQWSGGVLCISCAVCVPAAQAQHLYIIHQQRGALIWALHLPFCPSAAWQVNHLFSCCDSTILISVTSAGQAGPHASWTHIFTAPHRTRQSHYTHTHPERDTRTLFFCVCEGILAHSRAERWHLIMSQMKQEWQGGEEEEAEEEERWRDGWSGTTEQYGGGWVEPHAGEATRARRQVSGVWNRLGESQEERAGMWAGHILLHKLSFMVNEREQHVRCQQHVGGLKGLPGCCLGWMKIKHCGLGSRK